MAPCRYEEVVEVDERIQLALSGVDVSKKEGTVAVKGVSGETVEIVKPLDEERLKPALQVTCFTFFP